MPVLGAREIATGVGILASGRPTGWLWTRVLGDVIDLAVLGRSLRGSRRYTRRSRLLGSIAAIAIVAALATCSPPGCSRSGGDARASSIAPPEPSPP
jgi:hypothetical protein